MCVLHVSMIQYTSKHVKSDVYTTLTTKWFYMHYKDSQRPSIDLKYINWSARYLNYARMFFTPHLEIEYNTHDAPIDTVSLVDKSRC